MPLAHYLKDVTCYVRVLMITFESYFQAIFHLFRRETKEVVLTCIPERINWES